MTTTTLRRQIIDEISRIPENKLTCLFDVIHTFRLGLDFADQKEQNYDVQKILEATNGIFGLWQDKNIDVDNYIRDLRKDRNL